MDNTTHALFGTTKSEFGGNHQAFLDKLHPDDKARMEKYIEDALKGVLNYSNEFRVLVNPGEVRHIRTVASIAYDAQGVAEHITGVNWDITEYNRILAELQTFNEVMVDREGRIIELKEEINHLASALGKAFPYPPVWDNLEINLSEEDKDAAQ